MSEAVGGYYRVELRGRRAANVEQLLAMDDLEEARASYGLLAGHYPDRVVMLIGGNTVLLRRGAPE